MAARLDVEDGQLAHTGLQQGVGHSSPGPAGAHLHHALARHSRQAAAEALGEALAVGIVADTLAVLEHHGVHRADAEGFRRQLIEQRDDCLLAGEGDVQAGEAHALGGAQQLRQSLAARAELVQVDQSVQVADTLGIAPVLVHGRGARALDAGSDQTSQDALRFGAHGLNPSSEAD
ncbi:hypothetical protein GCM10027514_29520 [Azotobacter armeniacus]